MLVFLGEYLYSAGESAAKKVFNNTSLFLPGNVHFFGSFRLVFPTPINYRLQEISCVMMPVVAHGKKFTFSYRVGSLDSVSDAPAVARFQLA